MNFKNTFLLLIIALTFTFIYPGCDDAGVTTINQNSTFNSTHLNHLNVSDSAMYELFVNIDSSGGTKYCSMGKFNINASGQAVDSAGNSKNFKFDFTPDLPALTDAFVTMEPLIDFDTLPNGPKIMGAARTYVAGVLTYNMSMEYPGVLGSIAAQFNSDSARYLFATPTDGSPVSQWQRGIWFTTDPFGNNPGITCQALTATDWIYHAYVFNLSNTTNIYNVGRFNNPNDSDDYSACNSNVVPQWQKPGQDWLKAFCPGNGIPDIDSTVNGNLNSGNYGAIITIEPKNRPASLTNTPFFIKLFFGNIGVAGWPSYSSLPNVAANYLPTATVQLTQKSGQ